MKLKPHLFQITLICFGIVILSWAVGGYIESEKESIFLGAFITNVFYVLYFSAGTVLTLLNLYSFYLVYKYAIGERTEWFLGLLFFGMIVFPIVIYRYSNGKDQFNENKLTANKAVVRNSEPVRDLNTNF